MKTITNLNIMDEIQKIKEKLGKNLEDVIKKRLEFPPTVLTREDIDNFMKRWEEDLKKPDPTTNCTSCEKAMLLMLTDYYTGQCQDCFYSGKKWCHSSPVKDAFFVVEDGK